MKTFVAMFVSGLLLLAGCQSLRGKCTCRDAQAKEPKRMKAPAGGAVWSGDATQEGTVEVTSACSDRKAWTERKFVFKTKQGAKETAELFAANWDGHHKDACRAQQPKEYLPGTYDNTWIVEFQCPVGQVPEIWCDENPCDDALGTEVPIGFPGIPCRGHSVWRVQSQNVSR